MGHNACLDKEKDTLYHEIEVVLDGELAVPCTCNPL